MGHRVLIPTGASAALDNDPEYNFVRLLQRQCSNSIPRQACFRYRGGGSCRGRIRPHPPWTDAVLIASWMDYGWDLSYEELEGQIVDGVVMFCY